PFRTRGVDSKGVMRMAWNRARGLTVVLALVGCTGAVTDPREETAGPGPPPDDPAGPGGSGGSGGSAEGRDLAPEAAGLRRLTVRQYENSLRDLFGPKVAVPADLEPDTVLHGMAAIGASRIALSTRATEQFEAAGRS